MTKQLLKGLGAASLAALVMAIFCVPGNAADIRCRVPFRFQVNGATLPPGTYTVSTNQGVLIVRGATGGAMVLTNRIESRDATDPKLVFRKYGQEYILREAWTGGSSGRTLPESRRERQLASEGSRSETASGFERVEVPVL